MHDEIRKFQYEGVVKDQSDIVTARHDIIHWLEVDMRDEGCVPLLDMDPQYTHQFDPASGGFNFKLTVYAVEVGKEKAWEVAGMMSGKPIMISTPPRKSKQSLDNATSKS